MPARRSHARRDWPPHLYESPEDYYRWRHPITRAWFQLGA